jgi:rare lipoprotein A
MVNLGRTWSFRPAPVPAPGVALAFLLLPFALPACAHDPATKGFNAPPGALSQDPQSRSAGAMDFAREANAPHGRADQVGLATWYGEKFEGKPTANGERFDVRGMTAAHLTLPFGTWVEVRRPDTGRSVRVRINDRGPHGDKRKIIDLSRAAAEALDIIAAGYVRVELRVVRGP